MAALLVALVLGGVVAAQESRPGKTPEVVVQHLLGPSPTLRSQAVAWARAHPAEVAPLIQEALKDPPPNLRFDAVRCLGDIRAERVSLALIGLIERPGFPWRPHALEALADHEFPPAGPVFLKHYLSPVARSRAACCRGIGALGLRDLSGIAIERLGDEEAAVRLEAARTLLRFGDFSGVPAMARDLSLDRRFADQDPGAVAREAAARFLVEAGLAPELVPEGVASPAGVEGVLSHMRMRLGAAAARFPEFVPVHEPDADASYRFAVETRSCLEGDFFLRLNEGGQVILGRDRLHHYRVPPEAVAPIVTTLLGLASGRARTILGDVTCDFERFHFRGDDGTWRCVVIGPERRDASWDAIEGAVADVLRRAAGPAAAEAHQRRVAPFRAPAK